MSLIYLHLGNEVSDERVRACIHAKEERSEATTRKKKNKSKSIAEKRKLRSSEGAGGS